MVKIYKEDRLVIIEGVGEFVPSTLSYTATNGTIDIISNGLSKSVFNADWSIIADKDGNSFSDETTLTTYLSETLTQNPFNIDGGIIF